MLCTREIFFGLWGGLGGLSGDLSKGVGVNVLGGANDLLILVNAEPLKPLHRRGVDANGDSVVSVIFEGSSDWEKLIVDVEKLRCVHCDVTLAASQGNTASWWG
jgi:hypothetical protein